jgi:hypothetical protein
MSKSNTFETALMQHIFQNTACGTIGDATGLQGSSAAGSLYISLHSSDPADTGSQTTNELAYTNYARIGVARGTATWGVTTNTASNLAAITFPACGTVAGGTATYFGVGGSLTGTGHLLYSGSLTASLGITGGVTPSFAIGALTVTED